MAIPALRSRMLSEQTQSVQQRNWLAANEAIRDARLSRSSTAAQIAELAGDPGFRLRYRDTMLNKILKMALAGTAATMGNLQLWEPQSRRLAIHAYIGFRLPFLEFFSQVESGQAACGAALRARARTIVADTTNSRLFFGTQGLEVLLDAGVRAVQSTPIIGVDGTVLGILSTHYSAPRQFRAAELRALDHFAHHAGTIIEWNQAAEGRPNPPIGATTVEDRRA